MTSPNPGDPSQGEPTTPTQIGPYRILEEIGRGGMGTVYRAEQRGELRREVAVKVVQAGMGTEEVLKRFRLERRALAAMSHPNIARVFDAGSTEQGAPYFAMEYVQGLPLTAYCDKHRLSVADRCKLFQQVCAGVQHAHQKGVVHRDLKPGNVLVVREGDEPVVKILDFGLAKATDRDFLDGTFFTERDRIMGTPEYMAPEQAAGDGEVLDSRADVYSLGVMLYELLSGELPFTTEELKAAGQMEAMRLIRDVEPPKPSTRVRSRIDSQALATQRRSSTGALTKALQGDLDWVILKAMSKEPERRYDSATGLGLELQRYLDKEPVLAGPPGVGYRLGKYWARNKLAVATAAVLLVAIPTVSILGGYWLSNRDRVTTQRNLENRIQLDREILDAFQLLHTHSDREAIAAFEQLLTDNPEDEELQGCLALALLDSGEAVEASRLLSRAVGSRAIGRRAIGLREVLHRAEEVATGRDSDRPQTPFGGTASDWFLVSYLIQSRELGTPGEKNAARFHVAQAILTSTRPRLLYYVFYARAMSREVPGRARALADTVVRLWPQEPYAHYARAMAIQSTSLTERRELMVQAYRQAVRLYGDRPFTPAIVNLCSYLIAPDVGPFSGRDIAEAEKLIARALTHSPDHPNARFIHGRVQLHQGRHQAAMESFGRLQPGTGAWIDAQLSIGHCLELLGRPGDAREWVARIAPEGERHKAHRLAYAWSLVSPESYFARDNQCP